MSNPKYASDDSNLGFKKTYLFISEIRVHDSTFFKRFQHWAKGRGYPIRKSMCQIIIKSNWRSIKEGT